MRSSSSEGMMKFKEFIINFFEIHARLKIFLLLSRFKFIHSSREHLSLYWSIISFWIYILILINMSCLMNSVWITNYVTKWSLLFWRPNFVHPISSKMSDFHRVSTKLVNLHLLRLVIIQCFHVWGPFSTDLSFYAGVH